jgi:protein-disulfide isomerase
MKRVILAISLLLVVSACGEGKKSTTQASQPPAAAPEEGAAGTVIAKINGQPITDEDVRKVAGAKLSQAEMELYEARKEGIDQIIDDKLLEAEASRQGTAKDQLLKKNVYDKIQISDKEIEKFYNEKKGQMQGKKLDEVKGNIRGFLFREKYQNLYGDFMKGLKKKADIAILIKAPKVEVPVGDSPSIGPKDAPVTVVEFTDYQCPFCGRARPTINQVLETYKGKVRYVLRDFPLSFHKDAMKAHEAFHCAGEQGKYWEMNKKLWDNQKAIKVDDLKKYAQEIKLNTSKFNECLDSGKYTDKVKQSQEDGEKVGVSGTPAFFVNGRMISGARPFESFKEIIDDELEQHD